MTARKCKVCGVRRPLCWDNWCGPCAKQFRGYKSPHRPHDIYTAAEWGAKRRADAVRKGGGK